MTTDQMKTFLIAAEYLNFTKAAEQLYITQSAISRQISTIEQELNCRLFVRQNSQLRLTNEGLLLYKGLSKIYNDYSILLHSIADSSTGMSGEICIGVLDDQIVEPWLGNLFSDFTTAHPNVRVSFQRLDLQHINQALRDNRVDVAITLFRGNENVENMNQFVYAHDQMYLAVPKPLVPQEADPSASDYFESLISTLPMAMIAPENFDSSLTGFAWNVLNNKVLKSEIRFEADMGCLVNLVTSGLYCTVANETNVLALYPEITLVRADRFGKIRKGIRWMTNNINPLIPQLVNMIRENCPPEESEEQD